jgi:Zn-dependent peptidase ImmA (M78 family)
MIDQLTGFSLAGNRWSVLYKPKKEMHSDGHDCYGLCFEETNEIWIYNRLGKAKRIQTLLHEAGHAILYTMGHDNHDEREVEAAAQLIYQLLNTLEHEDVKTVGTKKSESTGTAV